MSKFTHHELFRKLKDLRAVNTFPNLFELPLVIELNSDFWKTAIQAYKQTRGDGHERAFSVFFADGELITTELIRGGQGYVNSNTSVNVEYKPSHKPEYYDRIVTLNGKGHSKRQVYYKDAPKTVEVMYLFNVHTHPQSETSMQSSDFNSNYTFSTTDINSFYNSAAIMTGVITDRLWLLFRTKASRMPTSDLSDAKLTRDFLVNELNYALYEAKFKGRAVRSS